MHNFEVHSNESACRKSGHLGLDQVNQSFKVAIECCRCIMYAIILDGLCIQVGGGGGGGG